MNPSSRIIILLFLLFMGGISSLKSQTSNLRWEKVAAQKDTLILDSLTIYQNSFKAFCGDQLLDSSNYYFDGNSREFFLKESCKDSLQLRYRVFSIDFEKTVQTLDTSMIYKDQGRVKDFYYTEEDKSLNFFSDEG